MYRFFLLPSIAFCFLSVQAQEEKKSYTTGKAESEIVIDGKLDDDAWGQVEWGGDFVGHQPEYKVVPSEPTQFKILYDAKYLYVGVRAFDSEPDKIVKRMSRRDGFDGDWVEINIDSYHDQRSAFSFTASVSGVKGDEYISNNGDNWDSTWDPIWYLKTSVDDKGWIAEFKIPLSQLRFANKEIHTWGIQFTRRFFRKEERSTWQPVNPTAPGWVHLFGELNGIKGVKPQKQLEIQPYVVGSVATFPKEADNPFKNSGNELNGNVGVDAKIGLTSDITLDLTVNPDFGQVEADPSRVNLSAFRLFFREQRPFFLEGANVLDFPTSGGINNLYYSRRIGGPPKGDPDGDNVDHVDKPNQTRILGAAKITGKNAKGFSWGVLESFTNRELARVVDTVGGRRNEKVEPYTNYVVARAQQDIDGGKTVFGAFFSNVNRMGNDVNGLELLHDNAQSGGFDLDHNFKDRKYGFILRGMFSRVAGSQGAIYETQTASERFFQRSNNHHKNLDSTRTSLVGTVGTFAFGKRSGNWRWSIGSNYRSPNLELNDVGFLVQTDNVNNWLWTQYRVTKPTKLFRAQRYNIYAEQNVDFGGVQTSAGTNIEANWQFHNFWNFGTGTWMEGRSVSNADLRGGPSFLYPKRLSYWYWFRTNDQKKLSFRFNNSFDFGHENFTFGNGISFNIRYRPTDAMSVSLSPDISWQRNNLQYIDQFESGSTSNYLLGRVNQSTYSLSLRMNYNITPNLTLEFWGQPFIAKGEYDEFKWVNKSKSAEYERRFSLINESDIVYNIEDAIYSIDQEFEFDDPDFNFVEFRSNFVMRWEYVPGSTLFFVWSNNGSYDDQSERNSFARLSSKLTGLEGNNTFLIKYTYRFIL
ncbi:MAG: carbohydrate binding family 9 domain-containing protein [Cyclobacteriaceae bacterium]